MINRFSLGVALFTMLVVPAFAESVDMSTITCEQTLAGNTDDMTTTLIWLDGWLAGQADDTMLDPDQLGKQVEGILTVCQENASMSLMNAAKQYLAE